jgi:hypothetical protein
MRESNGYLDSKVAYAYNPTFRSDGERKISRFLDTNSISYRYESPVLVDSVRGKRRIWYPDFYLPEFKTYIEYYGMAGNRDYAPCLETKRSVYQKMGLDVIPIYPWMINENWQGYIMRELKRTSKRNYAKIMSKPYWVNNGRQFYQRRLSNGYRRRHFRSY